MSASMSKTPADWKSGSWPTEVGLDFTEAGIATIGGNFSQTDTGLFGVELGGLVQADAVRCA